MNIFIVDTNVAVVANGRNTHASYECQLRCAEILEKCRCENIIAIDDIGCILDEYDRELNISGQPNVGDLFYKHVFDNQYMTQYVHRVSIHKTNDGSFEEFPDDAALARFDADDHMFVAVSLTHADKPPILNAVDSDWANHHEALTAHGVTILYICPEYTSPDDEDN